MNGTSRIIGVRGPDGLQEDPREEAWVHHLVVDAAAAGGDGLHCDQVRSVADGDGRHLDSLRRHRRGLLGELLGACLGFSVRKHDDVLDLGIRRCERRRRQLEPRRQVRPPPLPMARTSCVVLSGRVLGPRATTVLASLLNVTTPTRSCLSTSTREGHRLVGDVLLRAGRAHHGASIEPELSITKTIAISGTISLSGRSSLTGRMGSSGLPRRPAGAEAVRAADHDDPGTDITNVRNQRPLRGFGHGVRWHVPEDDEVDLLQREQVCGDARRGHELYLEARGAEQAGERRPGPASSPAETPSAISTLPRPGVIVNVSARLLSGRVSLRASGSTTASKRWMHPPRAATQRHDIRPGEREIFLVRAGESGSASTGVPLSSTLRRPDAACVDRITTRSVTGASARGAGRRRIRRSPPA